MEEITLLPQPPATVVQPEEAVFKVPPPIVAFNPLDKLSPLTGLIAPSPEPVWYTWKQAFKLFEEV